MLPASAPALLCAAAGLTLALSLSGPGVPAARAAEGIYMTWDDCFQGPSATSNRAFACNSNSGQSELYVAFTMPQAANNVIAVEIVIDLQHASVALPDWWHLEPNGCRGNELTLDAAASFPGRSACTNMWQGAGTPAIAQVADYIPSQPGGAASQSRIKVTASVLPSDARILDATSMYYAARLTLKNTKTVGDMACTGCSDAACLVLNSILVGRLAGSVGGDYFLQTAGAGDANWARWQGGSGANCAAVPVKNRAWGQLKGLYR
jgi:hypothetical protein